MFLCVGARMQHNARILCILAPAQNKQQFSFPPALATAASSMSSNQNQAPVTGGGGFLRVLYGNGNVLLCNTDCSCLHLFSYIRDTCAPDASILSLELCTEKGRLSGSVCLHMYVQWLIFCHQISPMSLIRQSSMPTVLTSFSSRGIRICSCRFACIPCPLSCSCL
jgi:hypothetical protein